MENLKIFDAEYRFLCVVWEHEPVNSTELAGICRNELGWKKSTTYSVIKRLASRGVIRNENAVVTTLMKRSQVRKLESEQILEKAFDTSLPCFVAAFLQGRKLTREEAEQIGRLIEEAAK
jgi:predicted transcriptional regulator